MPLEKNKKRAKIKTEKTKVMLNLSDFMSSNKRTSLENSAFKSWYISTGYGINERMSLEKFEELMSKCLKTKIK